MKKKITLLALGLLGTCLPLTSCSAGDEIIYMNFKPELTESTWNPIVAKFKEETGIKVNVVTAASGQYESTLRSRLGDRKKPTIFQINGGVGYRNFADYCANDLTDTDFYKKLTRKSEAVIVDNKVKAVPVAIEGYGIIYNKEITKTYKGLTGASDEGKALVDSNGKILAKSYEQLKTLVEDMQTRKSDLGIDGVFSSTGLDDSTSWRITGHLFNLPLYGEVGNSSETPDKLKFTYAPNYKNVLDLYLKNSPDYKDGEIKDAIDKTMKTASSQFATKKTVMIQNGNWATADLTKSSVKKENLDFLPIYSGKLGESFDESKQGLCIGTESYLTVNEQSTAKEKENGIKFLNWLFTGKGQSYVSDSLGFISPFEGQKTPTDVLSAKVFEGFNDSSLNPIPWKFTIVPSTDNQRADLVTSLKKYYNSKMSNESWMDLVINAQKKWEELAKQAKS